MLLVHQVLNVPSPQNWLMKDEGWIRLSSRFIAEMEPYLKEVHGNEIADCKLCKKTVIRVSLSVIIHTRDRSDHVIGQNLEVDLKISSEYSTILPIFR